MHAHPKSLLEARNLRRFLLVSLMLLVSSGSSCITRQPGPPAAPAPPAPPPVPAVLPSTEACLPANMPAVGAGALVIPPGAVNGGAYTGRQGVVAAPIQLTENAADLIIVTQNNLDIQADILFPARRVQANSRSQSIWLISLQGTVTVQAGVTVGSAAGGVGGPFGSPGGDVTLYGNIVDIGGSVRAMRGGNGRPARTDAANPGVNGNAGTNGGQAILCATEGILLTAQGGTGGVAGEAWGGDGGSGGIVNANGTNSATSSGAAGGDAGDVHFIGLDPAGNPVPVRNAGTASGGKGGNGSNVNANATNAENGGPADATGGDSGVGGSVRFRQAEVMLIGVMAAGDGGVGGRGTAEGGKGADGAFSGDAGGNAKARGGAGGAEGTQPGIPLPNNVVVAGVAGTPGPGGNADAYGGDGGSAAAVGPGGNSGWANARGGPNGAGAGVPVVNLPVVVTTTRTGATGPIARSAGAP